MFKKLLFFGIAAGIGYVIASNPEIKKQLVRGLEQGRAKINDALENARQASAAKEQEIKQELKVRQ
jgi:hypothetical protein